MERLFVVIGRINSILLLLALLGAGAFIGWMAWPSAQREERGAIEVPASQTEKVSPVLLRFERIQNIIGADTQMMNLTTEGRSGKFSSGGGSYVSEIRNVLFLTGDGKKARWLFPTHGNKILVVSQLREDSYGPGAIEKPTAALYFEYVTGDAGGDKISKIAMAKPDGTGFVEVLDGVDRVIAYQMLDSQRLTVVYQKGKSVHHARFSVTTMTKEFDAEIVSVPDRL